MLQVPQPSSNSWMPAESRRGDSRGGSVASGSRGLFSESRSANHPCLIPGDRSRGLLPSRAKVFQGWLSRKRAGLGDFLGHQGAIVGEGRRELNHGSHPPFHDRVLRGGERPGCLEATSAPLRQRLTAVGGWRQGISDSLPGRKRRRFTTSREFSDRDILDIVLLRVGNRLPGLTIERPLQFVGRP